MSNQKLESALAELKKFKDVFEPETYEEISFALRFFNQFQDILQEWDKTKKEEIAE